jgi:hypothetical protein
MMANRQKYLSLTGRKEHEVKVDQTHSVGLIVQKEQKISRRTVELEAECAGEGVLERLGEGEAKTKI